LVGAIGIQLLFFIEVNPIQLDDAGIIDIYFALVSIMNQKELSLFEAEYCLT
jgi:hypothetical protein